MSVATINLSFPKQDIKPVSFSSGLYINGEFVNGSDGVLDVVNPTTEKTIAQVALASASDVDLAVDAAEAAFNSSWGLKVPGIERGKILIKIAELIEANLDTIAAIESLDNGKAFAIAKSFDITAAAACYRYYGGWADKIHGKTIETHDDKLTMTLHEPVGVCGQIIPWNFPFLMFAWKVAPALACGNTIVMKTSENTPLSGLYLINLIHEANILPKGVLNIITGHGAVVGNAISGHMRIDKVAFTGSTAVGRQIMKNAAASNLKKVTLELGGKSPNVVLEDADLEQAASWACFGLFFNHGQTCCAGSRVYVHEKIYEKFMEVLHKKVDSINVGDPFAETTFQGPQVSKIQYDRILSYVESGKSEGATLTRGGEPAAKEGYFIKPTIFTDVKPGMKIVQEEIFGPVVVVAKFSSTDDILALANDSIYGLAAAVFSRDISNALNTAKKLRAGTVWVNCYNALDPNVPFGGFKQSGIGRECGEYALENYTEVKAVHVNLNIPAPF